MKNIYTKINFIASFIFCLLSYMLVAQAPTDNLVAHFDFESITNNNISSASGSGSANVGTLNNVTPVTENGNTVLDFDSSSTPSYVRFDQSNRHEHSQRPLEVVCYSQGNGYLQGLLSMTRLVVTFT